MRSQIPSLKINIVILFKTQVNRFFFTTFNLQSYNIRGLEIKCRIMNIKNYLVPKLFHYFVTVIDLFTLTSLPFSLYYTIRRV